jgi:hypothetical protein
MKAWLNQHPLPSQANASALQVLHQDINPGILLNQMAAHLIAGWEQRAGCQPWRVLVGGAADGWQTRHLEECMGELGLQVDLRQIMEDVCPRHPDVVKVEELFNKDAQAEFHIVLLSMCLRNHPDDLPSRLLEYILRLVSGGILAYCDNQTSEAHFAVVKYVLEKCQDMGLIGFVWCRVVEFEGRNRMVITAIRSQLDGLFVTPEELTPQGAYPEISAPSMVVCSLLDVRVQR